jgi:hypothetical protein
VLVILGKEVKSCPKAKKKKMEAILVNLLFQLKSMDRIEFWIFFE